jgi:hypothetical protein
MGTSYAELVLFNAGGVDCTLPAVPTLQVRDARGHLAASTGPPQATSEVVLPAASTAVASVAFSDWCVAPPVLPLHLDLLIGATELPVNAQPAASPKAVIPVPGCMSGLATPPPSFFYNSPFTILGSPEPPAPDPGDYLPVSVTVSPLTTVPAGSVMAYSVTLTNTDAYRKPYNLNAFCPTYVERLFLPARQGSIDTELALNCSAAGVLAGGGHLTFEMRLPIPPDAAAGQAALVWQLGQRGAAAKVLFTIGP